MSSPLQHLFVLCCYGGQPFVDFHPNATHKETHQIDPTEWIATDTNGALLSNQTLDVPGVSSVLSSGTTLSRCDLFNVTFLTSHDQQLFTVNHAQLACRCPPETSGSSCEQLPPAPLSLPLSQSPTISQESSPMIIILAAVLLVLFAVVFMMVSGCWFDCFGPCSFSCSKGGDEPYDKPLDPRDVEKCLRKYKAHEARMDMAGEQHRPLVSTISQSCPAPYNTTVLPSPPPPPVERRAPSPPPSYSSVAGSTDRLPTSSI